MGLHEPGRPEQDGAGDCERNGAQRLRQGRGDDADVRQDPAVAQVLRLRELLELGKLGVQRRRRQLEARDRHQLAGAHLPITEIVLRPPRV